MRRTVALAAGAVLALGAGAPDPLRDASATRPSKEPDRVTLDLNAFRRVESGSGLAYYQLVEEDGAKFIRGDYRPGMETITLAAQVPEEVRSKAKRLRWRWRVRALPDKADECRSGYTDSAAVVYVTFKRGLMWHVIKYVWSTVGKLGATCDLKRTVLTSQDTVILESGGPLDVWREEEIDLSAAYLQHYEPKNPRASVPDLVGVAILTDGDQTRSAALSDYADFTVVY